MIDDMDPPEPQPQPTTILPDDLAGQVLAKMAEALNTGMPPDHAFVLVMAEHRDNGRIRWIANLSRENVLRVLGALVAQERPAMRDVDEHGIDTMAIAKRHWLLNGEPPAWFVKALVEAEQAAWHYSQAAPTPDELEAALSRTPPSGEAARLFERVCAVTKDGFSPELQDDLKRFLSSTPPPAPSGTGDARKG